LKLLTRDDGLSRDHKTYPGYTSSDELTQMLCYGERPKTVYSLKKMYVQGALSDYTV